MFGQAQDGALETGDFHAWNPGLVSGLPRSVRSLATVFRTENVEPSFREIDDLADLSGLPASQLAEFRPERLVIHEVLIRVMADFLVPLGTVYADHGVNFRRMVATILRNGIDAHLTDLVERLRAIREQADAVLDREIADLLDDRPREATDGEDRKRRTLFGFRLVRRDARASAPDDRQARALRRLEERDSPADTLEKAAREALRTVVASVIARQGILIRDRALLRRLAGILVSNDYGSHALGIMIEPWVDAVAAAEGYRRLAPQDRPIVMTVKGASASGKSTIRPYQRALAERVGADWADFAVIAPDVWRKFLLDYDSLGEVRRYAGPLTAHELEIVDAKLDRHMARKAAAGRISHLLIDRFRFDSFATDLRADGTGQLLTRFGDRIYLQFMVTRPEATVERAWKRGEVFGRYKAVEDLLAHNVEAYAGMPRLFFLWVLRQDKAVAFEFLDNSVPQGETPRTIAFGINGAMTILDPRALLDVERFRKINIHARAPDEVYAGLDLAPERNAGFLRDCLQRLATVRFAERETGRVFACFERSRLVGVDRVVLARVSEEPAMREALLVAGLSRDLEAAAVEATLRCADASTLGDWGPGRSRLDA